MLIDLRRKDPILVLCMSVRFHHFLRRRKGVNPTRYSANDNFDPSFGHLTLFQHIEGPECLHVGAAHTISGIFCFHDLMSYVTYGRIDLKATCHYLGSHGGLICISWCKEQLERVSDILGFSLVRNDLDCSVFRFN